MTGCLHGRRGGNRSEEALLFSESNSRSVVEVASEDQEAFECGPDGRDFARVGKIVGKQRVIVRRMEDKTVGWRIFSG